jgi:beta-lactamase regulating signal transducer with metallopeptidase domain
METISRTLLTFLLNALWQAPLVWAVAALACRAMPNGPARHRYAVWVAALFVAFLLPSLSVRAPLPAGGRTLVPSAALPSGLPASSASAAPAVGRAPSAPAFPAPAISFSRDWALLLLGAYGVWLAFRVAQFALALSRAWRIRRDAAPGVPSPHVERVMARCGAALSLEGVDLLVSGSIAGPVALRRTIVLPAALFAETSEDVLTTAIGHEMAHVARRDFSLKLLYEMLYLPLSFHPAAMLIHRGIENSREMACDEMVAGRLLEPAVYARSIAGIAAAMLSLDRPGYVLGVFDGDILEERIRSLMERRGSDLRRARIALAAGLSALALCLVVGTGLAVSAHAQSAAQVEMQSAAEAYNRNDFAAAVDHFETAVGLEPANLKARLFLANAYIRQSIADNQRSPADQSKPLLIKAQEQYREVLARDPKNFRASVGIVSLNGPAQLRESRELMLQAVQDNPRDGDAYYTVGVLDWSIAYREISGALKSLGASPAVQQIPDAAIRAQLRPRLMPYIEEGFRMLQIALDKDPSSDDAMAYLNLMDRAKALLTDSPEEAAALTAQADQWVGKALAAKKAQASQGKPSFTIDVNADPPMTVPMPPAPPPPPPPGTAPHPPNPNEMPVAPAPPPPVKQ